MAFRVAVGKEDIRGARSMEGVVIEGEPTAAVVVDERARFAGRVDADIIERMWAWMR